MRKLDILIEKGLQTETAAGTVVARSEGSDRDLGLIRISRPGQPDLVEYLSTAEAALREVQPDLRRWSHRRRGQHQIKGKRGDPR